MMIIIKNIPAKTSKQELKDFLSPAVKGGWLRKSGQVARLSILTQRSIRTRETQQHGMVEILPDSVAERVVKKLNGKMLCNKHVAVCEYKIRNWHNDPRVNSNRRKNRPNDRRIGDRRMQYEEIISEEPGISSKRAFHMKGWE